jgi:putative intracellular protease/amidase
VKTEELEDDVAELVCHLAHEVSSDNLIMGRPVTEAAKQQFRDALNRLIDERIAERMVWHTPPKWRKGQQVIKVGNRWSAMVAPADRNVYVVTRDSWAESPTWVEPRETAKI